MVGQPVFRINEGCPAGEIASHVVGAAGGSLYFIRVPASDTERVSELARLGFEVVDCGITLSRAPEPAVEDPASVIEAGPEHAGRVAIIGGSAFAMSRFHLDPHMHPGSADAIKREWARNCATGGRGVATLVALHDGEVAGFLAVLAAGEDHVIDLVAVDGRYRGLGIGRSLVQAFIARFGPRSAQLLVGTQAANVASLRMYEALGFRVQSSHYAMHLHT
ncbi:MAG: GNAT family N-acetyltransferase [Thermoleophilia bacterium]